MYEKGTLIIVFVVVVVLVVTCGVVVVLVVTCGVGDGICSSGIKRSSLN